MSIRTRWFHLAGLLALTAGQLSAAPVASDYTIHITQFDTSAFSNTFAGTSASPYYQNTLIPNVAAYGDLSSGSVGSVSASGASSSYQSLVSAYDALTFDSSTTVRFSFTFDGTLSSNSIFDNPYGQGRIDVYDITGLSTWIETNSVGGLFELSSVASAATAVSLNSVLIDMDEINGFTTDGGNFTISQPLARDGTAHAVSHTLTGSFAVDPTRTYGIRLTANAFGSGTSGLADFYNTGAFQFTGLGGATFSSASGAFLQANSARIPDPPALWLLALGLMIVGRYRQGMGDKAA